MKTSPSGIAFIKSVEGLRLKAYQDSGGVWTIGYGRVVGVKEGMVITEAQADAFLAEDIAMVERGVTSLVNIVLWPHEINALVSFAFNVGTDIDADDKAKGLGDSTLLKLLNAEDRVGAAAELAKWHHAGGKRVRGLLIRRLREALMFLGETA